MADGTRRRWRWVLFGGLGAVAALVLGGAGWFLSLPAPSAPREPPPIPQAETDATLAALKPPKRVRPLVAIVGINGATETTDYLMPYGILRRADVADVVALATRPGPVKLYPALTVEPQATVAAFDAQHPDGADYVIVPAMRPDDDPEALRWIRAQRAKGATIISVCAGAKVLAAAGLLDGRRGTTHWWYVKQLQKAHPTFRYVPDRRLVADRGVVTTTGISASMPAMLTLIEAIAGREKAEATARDLGVAHWDARHDSRAFRFNRVFAGAAMANGSAFWADDEYGVGVAPGVDEVSLALVADAWSRTFRSHAVTFAGAAGPIETRGALRILPDQVAAQWSGPQASPALAGRRPAQALDEALSAIGDRYGRRTAQAIAMQLEYPAKRPL